MLSYLDALLDALALRDAGEVTRLLAHPLARILPEAARAEARAIADGTCDALAAPLRVLQLRHVTAELLREDDGIADIARPAVRAAERQPEPLTTAARSAPHPADGARAVAPGRDAGRAESRAEARRSPRLVQMELPLSA